MGILTEHKGIERESRAFEIPVEEKLQLGGIPLGIHAEEPLTGKTPERLFVNPVGGRGIIPAQKVLGDVRSGHRFPQGKAHLVGVDAEGCFFGGEGDVRGKGKTLRENPPSGLKSFLQKTFFGRKMGENRRFGNMEPLSDSFC